MPDKRIRHTGQKSIRESFATATFKNLGASVAAPPWFRQMVSLGKQLSGATESICEIINQQAKALQEEYISRGGSPDNLGIGDVCCRRHGAEKKSWL